MKDPAFKIAFGNLIRQKRRNILLGGAIAFGMAILVLAGAFGNGLTDSLLNRLLVNMAGHIQVTMMEKKGTKVISVIRDKKRLEAMVQRALGKEAQVEERIGTFCTALGNGVSDNMMLSAVPHPDAGFADYLHIEAGNFADFTNGNEDFPVILYAKKAKLLKVKVGDVLKIRMRTLYGQVQSATLRVVALAGSGNPFADMTGFVPISLMKRLMGYAPQETQSLKITLKKLHNPALAVLQANRVRDVLQPRVLLFKGELVSGNHKADVIIGGFKSLSNSSGILLPRVFSHSLNIGNGDRVYLKFEKKYGDISSQKVKIAGLTNELTIAGKPLVAVSADTLLDMIAGSIPANFVSNGVSDILKKELAREWEVLPGSKTSKGYREKLKKLRERQWSGSLLDVTSMYEIADQVVQMQGVIKMISFYAVLLLFLIILIGVANSMRMTVKERTREIGTMRAIGMQSKSVRNVFLFEALLLALFASSFGAVIGWGLSVLLSLPVIEVKTMLSIFFKDGHLVFLPSFGDFFSSLILILILTGVTAYFPARRAARMEVSDALRHSE